ncbi:hypothetical protein [Yersinia enterocolitica]|uniref:hypothetical protein n=1 Tax=Yersinia enterocolitica TaxID=630 RepID=UPI0005E5F85B|nr:hypothetical protein [Yersinia enterocolitica]CNF14175.1 Uncharacterised protein [Yersinia enterocolitica]
MLKKIIKETGSNSSEEKLASYADDAFLGLWAYPNVYSDEGLSKNKTGVEVCDLLVVFNNNVIIFSDKNCTFNHDIDVGVAWSRWFKKSVIASSKQLYGAEKFIREYPNRLFLDKKCTVNFPVEIKNDMRFFLIAVTNNSAKSASKYYDNVAVGSTGSLMSCFHFNADECYKKPFTIGDIYPEKTFTHVFDEVNLDLIFSTLNTITDFINYLCEKERVIRNGSLLLSGGEEATLGLYLLNDGVLIDSDKESGDNNYIIHEYMWKEYEESPQAKLHKAYSVGSVFWDDLIKNFSRSILNAEVGLGKDNDFNSHEMAVRELASESRISRYRLATSFLDKLKQVPSNRKSARLVESIDEKGRFYLFLFLPRDVGQDYTRYRLERVGMMRAYALVAQYKYKTVKKLTIIATEPKNSQGRSEDIMTCQFDNKLDRESRTIAKKFIEEEKILSDYSYK